MMTEDSNEPNNNMEIESSDVSEYESGDDALGDLPSDREKSAEDKHDAGGCTPFFLPCSQLQRWGEKQKKLHTEWGNIFFDLFFVAAAYNLGNLLREDLSPRGLLYTIALFFPIMNWWMLRMNFTARFEIPKDFYHNAFLFASLLPLATGILHIRPVPILSDPQHNIDMFLFCLSMTIGSFMYIGALAEVMYCQRHVPTANLFPEAFNACRTLFFVSLPQTIFNLAAAIYTGIEYYSFDDSLKSTEVERMLAATSDKFSDGPMDDLAAWLLIGGTLSNVLAMTTLVFGRGILYGRGADVNPQEYSVPLNVDFAIHRYGEWIMLLLGESILSLLIVDLSNGLEYYEIFFSGIVTVIFLEYLHFRSQPHEPDHHAFRTSRSGAFVFFYFMQVYSISLIVLGASYKFFLWEAVFSDEDQGKRRMLFPVLERLLAGESTSLRFDTDDRRQRIANFFSGSLALVWLCLDIISISHQGISANMDRLSGCPKGRKYAMLLVVLRVGLIVFAATLSQYVTNPVTLAFIGFLGIFAQLGLRFAGIVLFPPSAEEAEDEAIEKAINFAKARMRESEMERTHGERATHSAPAK